MKKVLMAKYTNGNTVEFAWNTEATLRFSVLECVQLERGEEVLSGRTVYALITVPMEPSEDDDVPF